jgi:hypothetical protein
MSKTADATKALLAATFGRSEDVGKWGIFRHPPIRSHKYYYINFTEITVTTTQPTRILDRLIK